ETDRGRGSSSRMYEKWKKQKVAHARCGIENADREQDAETATSRAFTLELLGDRSGASLTRQKREKSGCGENPKPAHQPNDSSPGHYRQQKSNDCRKDRFSQVAGKIVDS